MLRMFLAQKNLRSKLSCIENNSLSPYKQILQKSFKLHSSLYFHRKLLAKFAEFYTNFLYVLLPNQLLLFCYSQITNLLKNTLIGIEKLNSRQLYSLLVYTHPFRSTSRKYFVELFKTDSSDCKQIYLLPHIITLESYSRSFQCKILNNILYLNETFYISQIGFTALSFLQKF